MFDIPFCVNSIRNVQLREPCTKVTRLAMDEEKLVEAVRHYPCLCKLTEKGYKMPKQKRTLGKLSPSR